MQFKSLIIFALLSIVCISVNAQSSSMIAILEALSNMDIIIENKKLSKKIKRDMRQLQKRGALNIQDYETLKQAYENLNFVYNNDYLAQIKMDLNDIHNYKQLVKNPEKAANRYMYSYGMVADVYNEEFMPVLQEILYEEDNADFITIIKVGFNIFKKIVIIIKQRKIEKSDLLQIGISEANEFLFKKLELPEWDSYGITIEEDYYEEDQTDDYVEENTLTTEIEFPQNSPTTEDTYLPPISTAVMPYSSGEFHFEVYDENLEDNIPMIFQVGPSQKVLVPNFGQGNMSADLIVGKPNSKKPTLSKNLVAKVDNYVASFESSSTYPAETYYQIKTSTDGFTYIFAINSGNKMYGFYPYQGGIEQIPSGIGFTLSTDIPSLQTPNGSGNAVVSIPDEENYLMTYDANGLPPTVETLVVLFSKAELNLLAIFQQMESNTESISPQQKLAQILGTQAASLEQGEVHLIGDTFSYQLTEEDPIVLPLVFAIKRR